MATKENSVKAPISEPVAPTTMSKTKFKYEELSLEKPIFGASPFVVISAALSVIYAIIYMVFSLLVFPARFLIVCLNAATNWLMKTTEKLNAKGKGRESHVNSGETNHLLEASFSGKDKEIGNTEINNPNLHDNYKENQRLDASINTGCQTVNSVDHDYWIDNSCNNNGDGKQDFSYCVVNSSKSKDSFNNYSSDLQSFRGANICTSESKNAFNNCLSGLQSLHGANICTSKSEDAFNNKSSCHQTFRGAKIGNPKVKGIRHAYNNNNAGTQNFDHFTFTGEK